MATKECCFIDYFTLLSALWVTRARWREIQRFVWKFKTIKSVPDMQFWVFSFSKTEDKRSKGAAEERWRNGYSRNYFIKTIFCPIFSVIPKAQKYRECMETKK